MKKVWGFTKKFCKRHSIYSAYVFLFVNTLSVTALAALPGVALGILLNYLRGISILLTMFTFMGYAGAFVGFLGGALFLMQKEAKELDIKKES